MFFLPNEGKTGFYVFPECVKNCTRQKGLPVLLCSVVSWLVVLILFTAWPSCCKVGWLFFLGNSSQKAVVAPVTFFLSRKCPLAYSGWYHPFPWPFTGLFMEGKNWAVCPLPRSWSGRSAVLGRGLPFLLSSHHLRCHKGRVTQQREISVKSCSQAPDVFLHQKGWQGHRKHFLTDYLANLAWIKWLFWNIYEKVI